MTEKFLVALDGSPNSWKAFDLACDIAFSRTADISVMTVVADPSLPRELEEYADAEKIGEPRNHLYYELIVDKLADEARIRARKKRIPAIETLSQLGDPAESILDFARSRKVDMIFMGKRGFGTLKSLLLGSVTQKVSQLAPCTCVVVC